MITLKELGSKIRLLREELDFSQEYVAEYLDLNRQAIIAIEAGKRKIDSFELFKLADLFNFDMKELISKEEVQFLKFENIAAYIQKKEQLNDQEKHALIEFQKIYEDYEFMKKV